MSSHCHHTGRNRVIYANKIKGLRTVFTFHFSNSYICAQDIICFGEFNIGNNVILLVGQAFLLVYPKGIESSNKSNRLL